MARNKKVTTNKELKRTTNVVAIRLTDENRIIWDKVKRKINLNKFLNQVLYVYFMKQLTAEEERALIKERIAEANMRKDREINRIDAEYQTEISQLTRQMYGEEISITRNQEDY